MDDARGLNGENGAPTVPQLKQRIEAEFPGRMVEVKHDILRITPDSTAGRVPLTVQTGRTPDIWEPPLPRDPNKTKTLGPKYPKVSQCFGVEPLWAQAGESAALRSLRYPPYDSKNGPSCPCGAARSIAHFLRRTIAKSVCNRHAVSPRSLIVGSVLFELAISNWAN